MVYFVNAGETLSGVSMIGDSMSVYSGGIANDIVADRESRVDVLRDGTINRIEIKNGSEMYTYGIISDVEADSGAEIGVIAGAVNRITVSNDAYLYVSDGASITNAVLNSRKLTPEDEPEDSAERIDVYYGGYALETTVNGGFFFVCGTAENTVVNEGSQMEIMGEGSEAENITLNGNCWVGVCDGGLARNVFAYSDSQFEVEHNGTSRDVTMTGSHILVKGTAYNTVLNDAEMECEEGGFADGVTVGKGSYIWVGDGGRVANVTVSAGGFFNGFTILQDTRYAEGVHISNAEVNKLPEEWYDETDSAYLSNGESAVDCVINQGGRLELDSGASVSRITVNNGGAMTVTGAVTLADITVAQGGVLTVDCEVMENEDVMENLMSGTLRVSGQVIANDKIDGASGGDADFAVVWDISGSQASSSPMIVNMENLGTTNFSIAVSDTQASGAYILASGDGADGENLSGVTFDVKAGNNTLGAVGLDKSFTAANGVSYSVSISGESLVLNVSGSSGRMAASDIDGSGSSDVMFQYTGGNYQLGFWMNGTNEWRSQGKAEPAEWEVLGAYDMDSSGKSDVVLVGNVTVEGIKGAFIGYYKDADTGVWENISYLTNADNIVWKNEVGNLTGNAGKNSIVWHAAELGALGVWTDGTDNWVSLGSGYDASWVMSGTGDFDGDGKEEVLFNYGGSFYSVDIDGKFNTLGTAGDGWEVRAVGDFTNDDKDDIVIFHKDTGIAARLDDGQTWNTLGQLDAADWFVVGAGEYNGSGAEDLLVRQYSSGMLGYYADGDMTRWVELGRGVDMDWTVIA